MIDTINLNGKWILENDRTGTTEATVPGDITNDLYRAGKITDPYFGLNHRQIGWIPREDFIYKKVFDAPKDFLGGEVLLEFDGIDVFSEIYLNGELLGKTENMFLKYTFSVGNMLKPKGNQLEVRMKSTLNEMDKFDCAGYMSIFNVPRVFVRKAQCHFGWDWAPDICGYGIWGDVRLKKVAKKRLLNVQVIADDKGNATFLATLNYSIRATVDILGKAIDGSATKCNGDKLIFTVYDCGTDGAIIAEGETAVTGRKNFRNFKIKDFKLWWPNGYGEHPLYGYKVRLCENGEEISSVCGKFGFRKVELLTEPIDAELMGYKIRINGKDIFVKGSNWVPIECFTGTVKTEKYEKLISLAKSANLNMLRVWGGGIYEKDAFYELCDRYGIMVWQDFMFACSDLPEDNDKWVKNAVSECRYQIERLRNHPSVVYWCGGNEKTGSYGLMISKGDYFIDCILQGLVYSLDKTRPYARQSPCSLTDVGNDKNSGESHGGSFERALAEGVGNYRKYVAETVVPFISECAVMGPNSVETNKKIYPSDKLWPLGEIWRDRLMENPYSGYPLDFTDRQMKYAADLYGEPTSLEDFTVKGMTVHAETLKTEFEYARANSDKCSGFLNWMYSDIWPSGSWSIVDY
ncbi:MAG: hypothetical protein J5903_04385, partial [Clostridia bacterium]|nr:hypothetical protein [Clostridia bacterium]